MARATVTISIWQKPIVYKISWHCFLIAVTLMCWAVCPDCPLFNLIGDRGNINAEAYTATLRLTCRFYFVIFNVTQLEYIFLHADMRWCCHLPYISISTESCTAGCVPQCCPAGLSLQRPEYFCFWYCRASTCTLSQGNSSAALISSWIDIFVFPFRLLFLSLYISSS